MGIGAAFIYDLTFWPGDIAKTVLVALVAPAVHRAFPQLLPRRAARPETAVAAQPE